MRRWLIPVVLLVPALYLLAVRPDAAPRAAVPADEAPRPPPSPGVPRPSGATASLRIEVEGLRSNQGQVALALFADAASFRAEAPQRTMRVPTSAAHWTIEDLPAGTYAVKAYHDEDGDGMLDKGAFGAPTEPYGFSNDARGTFGPPGFEEAAFRYDGTAARVTFRVR